MVRFGERVIDDEGPCFITFEAGPTHDGVESAKRLVTAAAKAGGDAVKFQILDPDRLVADREQLFSFEVLVDRETGALERVEEPLYDLLKRRSLSADQWREVKAHADSLGLAFFATAGFEDEIELLEELKCDSIKIASADVNHLPLLRRAAKSGMCIQLDTGNATLGEVEAAVDEIGRAGSDNIIIHHCPSGYPARATGVNLNVIPTLKRMFPFPIAFSDHSPGWEYDIAAITLGAKVIEKTITEDRMTRSVEHVMSLEPRDMAQFVKSIRDIEIGMGAPRRLMSDEELEKRNAVRRSAYVKRDMKAGEHLKAEDIEYRRPGYGVPPSAADDIEGARLRANKAAGDRLEWSDFDNPK